MYPLLTTRLAQWLNNDSCTACPGIDSHREQTFCMAYRVWLSVYVNLFICKRTDDTGDIRSVRQSFFKKIQFKVQHTVQPQRQCVQLVGCQSVRVRRRSDSQNRRALTPLLISFDVSRTNAN